MDVPSFEFDTIIEKNARKKYACPMCQEILIVATKINCNHRFCKYCITKWMAYFTDCPVCRLKIEKVVPHQRTDKWIEQLYDLGTPEFRQDREMCVNYRKLRHTKMELVGVENLKCQIKLDHDQLLQEFGLVTLEPKGVSPSQYGAEEKISGATIKPVSSGKIKVSTEKRKEPERPKSRCHPDLDIFTRERKSLEKMQASNTDMRFPPVRPESVMKSLFFPSPFSRKTIPSVTQLTEMFNRPHDFSRDVTRLFGAANPTTFSEAIMGGNKFDSRFALSDEDREIDESLLNLVDLDGSVVSKDSMESIEECRPSSSQVDVKANSDHTFSLHYPSSQPSRLLTLAELTCHDDLVMVNDDDEDEEPIALPKPSEQRVTDASNLESGMGGGDTMLLDPRLDMQDLNSPTEVVQSMNAVKAETMRARIQHEIAKAMMPTIKPIKQHPSRGDCSEASNRPPSSNSRSHREQQNLQTCRQALLNLRLRLLPPTRVNEPKPDREKRIVSDSKFPLSTSTNVHKLCSANVNKRESFKQVKEMLRDSELLPKKYKSVQKMESFKENK